jgi:hypothetical protein
MKLTKEELYWLRSLIHDKYYDKDQWPQIAVKLYNQMEKLIEKK